MRHRPLLRFVLTAIQLLALMTAVSDGADKLAPLNRPAAEKVSFRQHVWPILKRHCRGCHSGAEPKGDLSIDTVKGMLRGGETGPLFERGKPDESLLLEMIAGDDPQMPPKPPRLSAAKIHTLRQWIFAGAKDDSRPGDLNPVVKIPAKYKVPPAIASVSLSPDGKWLAAACRSEVVLIDIEGNSPPRRIPTESGLITHVEFSPDGKLLAAAGGTPASFGEVRFFRATDGKLISARRIGHDTLFRGAFAPDGKAIALGGADGAIHIVPVDGKAKLRRFELHSDWVMDVAYSPDGKLLVSGGRDKATKVSSAETGRLLRSVDSSAEMIHAVSCDSPFAVSGGRARTLIGFEFKIALAGIQVTGAGNGARPINRRGQYAKNFETQGGEILDLAVSGDRKLLAVVGAFGGVRIYRTATRQRVAAISKTPAPIYCAALNSDGSKLAIGSKTGQVLIYDIPSGKLIKSLIPVPIEAAPKNLAAGP